MDFTPGVEIAISKALEESIDNCRVQHFSAPPNGTRDGMVQECVEWAATGRSGFVLWLVAASLR